jgi:hypothetical protein
MFSGPPLPLQSDLPLNALLDQIRTSEILGAWVRGAAHRLPLRETARSTGRQLLVSDDLGFLLGRCNRIALREGFRTVFLDAGRIIQWRTLQVITALPHLPRVERLSQLFPGVVYCGAAGLLIPISAKSPEQVLAECLAIGMQVTGSRVVYHPPKQRGPDQLTVANNHSQ